jgi:hypothetical protein
MAYDGDVNAHIIDPLAQYVPDTHERAQVRQLLIEARALLAKPKGWIKGYEHKEIIRTMDVEVFVNETKVQEITAQVKVADGYCMVGAIKKTSGSPKLASLALRSLQGEVGQVVPQFNDAPARKKKEVLAVFDQLIGPVVA